MGVYLWVTGGNNIKGACEVKVAKGKETYGPSHPKHPKYKEPGPLTCAACGALAEGKFEIVDTENKEEPVIYPLCTSCAEDILQVERCPHCDKEI